MASLLDKAISVVSPTWGLRRAQARQVLSYYEAAQPTTLRKQRKATGSADSEIRRAGHSLREQARHLEQNHDLARGVLAILVNNVVGPTGIGIEPQPRTRSGEIHEDFSRAIEALFRDWMRRPEVTWRHPWSSAQRLAARTWFRDGEVLCQTFSGELQTLDHGTRVPFSLELLEPDFLPLDLDDESKGIRQGVEYNAWGRPRAYHLLKTHPGEGLLLGSWRDTKRIPAQRIQHLAALDRLHQTRGVSVFASVLGRLDDIKDYEESERIAAKVAASMAGFIKKGTPDFYQQPVDENGQPVARNLKFRPGTIFDDLAPGEEIGTIDTNRPNPGLESFRNGQLRALASGPGVTYSSLSKNYDGSYSAQRQELIEGWQAYAVLSDEFTGRFVQPLYQQLVNTAVMAGQLVLPADLDPLTLDDALYIAPQMPWIDPLKEANAMRSLEQAGHASGPEIVRRRGRNPRDVIEQEKRWRQKWRDAGELITADPAVEHTPEQAIDDDEIPQRNRQT